MQGFTLTGLQLHRRIKQSRRSDTREKIFFLYLFFFWSCNVCMTTWEQRNRMFSIPVVGSYAIAISRWFAVIGLQAGAEAFAFVTAPVPFPLLMNAKSERHRHLLQYAREFAGLHSWDSPIQGKRSSISIVAFIALLNGPSNNNIRK